MELRSVTYLLLFVSTACTTAPVPEPVPQSTAIVYDGAQVIIGDQPEAIQSGRIVIDQGIISAVGSQNEVPIPDGAQIVDVAGMTIMPTLVNLHGHVGFQKGLTYEEANYTRDNILDHLNRYAFHGIGVIVSMGTDAGTIWREIQTDQANIQIAESDPRVTKWYTS